MSYESALEAAGAKVVAFEQFGSYQGDWYALVEIDGKRGWIHGWYGSCSGCDAFEAEFGFTFDPEWSEPDYGGDYIDISDQRHSRHGEYSAKLAAFGKGYLDDLLTQEQAEAKASENIEWDSDAETALAFLKANAEVAE